MSIFTFRLSTLTDTAARMSHIHASPYGPPMPEPARNLPQPELLAKLRRERPGAAISWDNLKRTWVYDEPHKYSAH